MTFDFEIGAKIAYLLSLMVLVLCLSRGQRQGHINLWELVTAADRNGETRTDSRKLFECGAFCVMTIAFAYWAVTDRLTEWYAAIYVAAFVFARTMRDREQRLNRAMEIKKDAGNS